MGARGEEVSQFWRERYEREAGKNWDKFYRVSRGFAASTPEREYLADEVPEELAARAGRGEEVAVMEVGCGTGHSVAPLASRFPTMRFFALDVSPRAVDLLRQNPQVPRPPRCLSWVCDVQGEDLPQEVASVDLTMLIFVLSSIAPQHHVSVLSKLRARAALGGVLVFRDYAEGDAKHVEFEAQRPPRKLGRGFYVRSDGTRVFFFDEEGLRERLEQSGWEVLDLEVERQKRGHEDRVFVKARCRVGEKTKGGVVIESTLPGQVSEQRDVRLVALNDPGRSPPLESDDDVVTPAALDPSSADATRRPERVSSLLQPGDASSSKPCAATEPETRSSDPVETFSLDPTFDYGDDAKALEDAKRVFSKLSLLTPK